jgi:hypothetical protein
MRIFILCGLVGFVLTSCDSPYGKIPDSPSAGTSVSTGTRLRAPTDSGNGVASMSGDSISSRQGAINNLKGK